MTSLARRRLVRDLERFFRSPPWGIEAYPFDEHMMLCQALIKGPPETVWEAGTFHLLIYFSEEYPTKPPSVRFISEIFHPNVYVNGDICLDTLQRNWTPASDISSVLITIQALLGDPNPNSPANADAAKLFTSDPIEYSKRVLRCVEDSWTLPKVNFDNVTKTMIDTD